MYKMLVYSDTQVSNFDIGLYHPDNTRTIPVLETPTSTPNVKEVAVVKTGASPVVKKEVVKKEVVKTGASPVTKKEEVEVVTKKEEVEVVKRKIKTLSPEDLKLRRKIKHERQKLKNQGVKEFPVDLMTVIELKKRCSVLGIKGFNFITFDKRQEAVDAIKNFDSE